jgi:hypothetical protein
MSAGRGHEGEHLDPLVRGMHQSESCKGPQGLAYAFFRRPATFYGDQETHAEESQAVEEVDRDDA